MAEKVASSFENLVVDPAKCARVCSPLSTCTACKDVCPEQAIEIDSNDIHFTSCIDCGICTTKCPTGALTWKSLTVNNLLAQVNKAIENGEEVLLHCVHHNPDNRYIQAIELPCLAMVTSEFWYIMLRSNGLFKIYLPESGCDRCTVKLGEQTRLEEIAQAEMWAGNQTISYLTKQPAKQSVEESLDQGRRNWLSAIFGSAKKMPATALYNWATEMESDRVVQSKWISPRRRALRYIVKREKPTELMMKLPIMNDACMYCLACSKLCPTKALEQKENRITIDPYLCTECRLCVDICFYKAVELESVNVLEATSTNRFQVGSREEQLSYK